MDLLMEIPGIPLTVFQANGHHAAGVWLLSNPRMAFNVFYQKGPFSNFLNIIIFGTGHIDIDSYKYRLHVAFEHVQIINFLE